jgi:Cu2+-exporting ATPase
VTTTDPKLELLTGVATPGVVPPECAHCGLPVPRGLIEPGVEHQFCCPGCAAVYEAIRGSGLDRFYALRDRVGSSSPPAAVSRRGFESFDDPAFHELYVEPLPGGLCRAELYLEGVHCPACVWLVERLPHVQRGVAEVQLDLRRRTARIAWDPTTVSLSRIARRLDSFGYRSHPSRGRSARELRRLEDRRALIRIAVAGAAAGNVMVMAFALYGGMFHGIEAKFANLFRYSSLALTLLAVLWPGRTFFQGAWAAVRTRTGHLDLPIAVGIAAGVTVSALSTVRGVGEVYYDSITVLIFLLLVGRWIQQRQQRASFDAIETLDALAPSTARRLEADGPREVPLEALRPGDVVEVRAGESIPADGRVLEGRSAVDRALLTGESRPVPVAADDEVNAATVNLEGQLHVQVEAAGEASRVGRLMRLVERCAAERAPVVRLADRIAAIFVIVVITLAVATAAGWWHVDPALAVSHALALLIVTCPCALGLATPLALMSAIGQAARRGILIKGGSALEALSRSGVMVFDKTGTLTQGRVALLEWSGPDELRSLIAAAERHSAHPVARAFVDAFAGTAGDLPEDARVTVVTGGGIVAELRGGRLVVGSHRFLTRQGVEIPGELAELASNLATRGLSPVFAGRGDRAEAVAGFGDPVEDDASRTIARLRSAGWRVEVLSGDDERVVRAVAGEVGIEAGSARGSVSPEEKLQAVRAHLADGRRVVMVGDGVNDAAALAAATVGVSVRGGAEASLAAADVFMREPGLYPVAQLVGGSRRTMGVIRRNLLVSLLYNTVGAGLAVAGLINPLFAAILMPLSSLTVVTLSVRSRPFGGTSRPFGGTSRPFGGTSRPFGGTSRPSGGT